MALPVLAFVYAAALVRRVGARRLGLLGGGAAGALIVVVAIVGGLLATGPTTASAGRASRPIDPSEFRTEVRSGTSPLDPVTLTFGTRMDPDSVAGSLRIDPATAVGLTWDASGTLLTVRPLVAWRAGTLHTLTVARGALDARGRPTESAVRAVFLTRPAVVGSLAVERTPAAGGTPAGIRVRLAFDGPVAAATIGFLVEPATAGSLAWDPAATEAAPAWWWTPAGPLEPGGAYRFEVAPGARDADGGRIVGSGLDYAADAAPAVVRFRPRDGWTDVSTSQVLSVRFTEPMDRASTEAAWSARIGETAITGRFSWAEGDTVLVFSPSAALGYEQVVTMTVAQTAHSAAGLPLEATVSAQFRTVRKTSTSGSGGSGGSGGGSVGSGTWGAVEGYYLGLLNCTRTGGWVTSSGTCSSPGGGSVAPIVLHAGISDRVARPYAKLLATKGICSHYADGSPSQRLARAGYDGDHRENLGCRSGDPYSAVLGSHLYFQSEKPCSGYCHYNNIMDPKMRYVGIGVWVASGRVRLVCDFWEG